MAIDLERARTHVQRFLTLIDESEGVYETPAYDIVRDEIVAMTPLVEKIADSMDVHIQPADLKPHSFVGEWPWSNPRTAAVRLLGAIDSAGEAEALFAPVGPRLAARGLHPWVWEPAALLWDGGHRRAAIQAAGTQIDTQLQAKLDRYSPTGAALVQEAFTGDPSPDRPKLRLPGYQPGTDSWKNAHEGAMHFGRGCFMAIRNLATHHLEEPDEQVALEQLAALSVLARWIDIAAVVRA